MRAIVAVSLVALLYPAAVLAQTAPALSAATEPPATAASGKPTSGGDITKDQYIERAVERARRAADKRFDRLDTNHDGVLSADERSAARAKRKSSKSQ